MYRCVDYVLTSFKDPRDVAGGVCDTWRDRECICFFLCVIKSYLVLCEIRYSEEIIGPHKYLDTDDD